jgi:hypothetical protein
VSEAPGTTLNPILKMQSHRKQGSKVEEILFCRFTIRWDYFGGAKVATSSANLGFTSF